MTLHYRKPTLRMVRSPLATPTHAPKDDDVPRIPRLRGRALQAMRVRVLARAGGLCECPECRLGYPKAITLDTFELDHVVRVSDGGDNSIGNLRAVHWRCHARLTAKQNAELSLYGCVLPEPELPPRRLPHGQDEDDMPC